MKNLKDESGQVLAITVLGMFLLFGCIALAVDVSMLFRARRNLQIAADSAAIAAALANQYGPNTPTQAADAAAAANGVTDPTDVTVNTSPTNGYHTGVGFVEVKIIQPTPTFFINVFNAYYTHRNNGTVSVGARAVAGTTPAVPCSYVTDTKDPDTLYIKGKGKITAPKCGFQVNSSSKTATCNQGAAKISAPFLHIVGGQDVGGPCKATPQTPVVTGVSPVGDPFKNFVGPTPTNGQCTTTDSTPTSGNGKKNSPYQIALTGTIGGPGASKSICYTYPVTITDATMGAGTYVFEAGVTLGGTIAVNSGTLDIEQGTFTQKNAQLSITAPADKTNPYNGIAIMQPSTNTTASTCDTSAPCLQIQFGSGNENLTGIIYAPTSEVYMQDEGGGVQAGGVVAYQLYVNSDLILTDSYSDANPSTTPLTKVTLVE